MPYKIVMYIWFVKVSEIEHKLLIFEFGCHYFIGVGASCCLYAANYCSVCRALCAESFVKVFFFFVMWGSCFCSNHIFFLFLQYFAVYSMASRVHYILSDEFVVVDPICLFNRIVSKWKTKFANLVKKMWWRLSLDMIKSFDKSSNTHTHHENYLKHHLCCACLLRSSNT